jgi:hypothetical protein
MACPIADCGLISQGRKRLWIGDSLTFMLQTVLLDEIESPEIVFRPTGALKNAPERLAG